MNFGSETFAEQAVLRQLSEEFSRREAREREERRMAIILKSMTLATLFITGVALFVWVF